MEQVFAPGGAIEALVAARGQGIVRNLGISGHADPDELIEAIERFPFDAVLLELNAADPYHLSFKEKLLPLAVEREKAMEAGCDEYDTKPIEMKRLLEKINTLLEPHIAS